MKDDDHRLLDEPVPPERGDLDPPPPPPAALRRRGAVRLDPTTARPAVGVDEPLRETYYVRDVLLVPLTTLDGLRARREAGRDPLEDVELDADERVERFARDLRERRQDVDPPVPVRLRGQDGAPLDAWDVLQRLRADRDDLPDSARRVALSHVVQGHPPRGIGLGVGVSGPTGGQLTGYSLLGSARLPVSVVLDPPPRGEPAGKGRRPVVAVLDTGCDDSHPWLAGAVTHGADLTPPIGYTDPATDPERHPDLFGPLDGILDWAAGHGTFICGLVRQACPEVEILSVRLMLGDGVVDKSHLAVALHQLHDLVVRHRSSGGTDGMPVDVVSLSLGFSAETWRDAVATDPLREVLDALARLGTVVVAAAGNDSSSRPTLPAAFALEQPDGAPRAGVGALNPNGSRSAFTNAGLWSDGRRWVTHYDDGAVLVSTLPALAGGAEPANRLTDPDGVGREDLDGDDYSRADGRGGFGIWSGTSFAAPLLGARVARAVFGDDGGALLRRADGDAGARKELVERAARELREASR